MTSREHEGATHAAGGLHGELHEALIRDAAEAIIFADRQGTIRLWNPGSEALFGYAAGEAVGQSLDIIIPEPLRRAHWEGYHRALAEGRTRHGRQALATRSSNKDGDRIYVELSFSVVRDPRGEVVGAMAVGRDITSRFQEDRKLKARLKELEAARGTSK